MRHTRGTGRTPSLLCLVATILFTGACAQMEPEEDFERARELTRESTGQAEVYDPYAPPLTDEELSAVLAEGLTLDEALRLALLNNRELQADFQEIGIAHADWVQARLPSNPTFEFVLMAPTDGGRTQLEGLLGFQLLELWRIPVREQAARRELEATVLRIARRAGERLAEAREAYYTAVAAEELHRVAQENLALATRSFEAVRIMHEAGVADAFDENLAQAPVLASKLAVATTRIEAASARRALAKELSIERPVNGWVLSTPLPDVAPRTEDPEQLVGRALAERLDLKAMDTAIEGLVARVELERRKVWGDLEAGPAAQRPAVTGSPIAGGFLRWTAPVFDQNQAQIARAEFELVQMVKLRESAEVTVAQDVRSIVDRLNTVSRNLDFYGDELLPQTERTLELARQSYMAGRTDLLALVAVQQQLLDVRRGHVTLRREAAAATAQLDRVVGAPVTREIP